MIVKEPLANGRLTTRSSSPELIAAARRADTAPDALALAAALAQPWADVVLSGAATVDQVRSNLAAIAVEPDPVVLEQLDLLGEDPSSTGRPAPRCPGTDDLIAVLREALRRLRP